VIVPPHPGILCAEGLLDSDLVADFVQASLLPFTEAALGRMDRVAGGLAAQAGDWFEREGVPAAARRMLWSVDLRYAGQNFELSIPCGSVPIDAAERARIEASFHAAHESAYGFKLVGEPVEFVSLRVKLVGVLEKPPIARRVAFAKDHWVEAAIYRRADLAPGQRLSGPAIVEQMDCTTPVGPRDRVAIDAWGNLLLDLGAEA
jgi:N-methylhydantoinase A